MLNNALFTVDYNEMVIVKDIDFYSLCEHHLLPFFGKCHVAYIPQRTRASASARSRGSSTIFARRLQVQERLTNQIAETIREKIEPLGVGVVMEAHAPVHVDARRREAELLRRHQRDARRVPRGRAHARWSSSS